MWKKTVSTLRVSSHINIFSYTNYNEINNFILNIRGCWYKLLKVLLLKSSRLIIMINNLSGSPSNKIIRTITHTQTDATHVYIHTRTFSITAHSCRGFLLIESAIVPELINSVWLSCCRGGSHYHHISVCMQNIVVKHSGRCSLCACTVGELNSHLYSNHIEKVWHQRCWWS